MSGVGVDIGGTKLLIVAGERSARLPTGPAATAAGIAGAIRRQLADWALRPSALGIAIPGLVDRQGRVLVSNVLPGLNGWSPKEEFGTELGCPIAVLNDAEAALVEEAQDLPADATVALVMAGTAIGAAFRVDGRPLRGASGWAGELGFFPQRRGGELMRLDELAGGRHIAASLGLDGAQLADLAQRGDARALAAIAAGGEALGLALAGVVNLFNPQRLLLGGGALELPGYEAAARAALQKMALAPLLEVCEVRRAGAGPELVARGAIRAAGSS
ncbi:ROK family protein [Roseateles violae]|uniref:ROK family protein n=1 Tax=Roseateles violae TaxID=3058042 RepID=A0ABT8DMQ2_9BURK|nr:ROK family protein [Pelomonas sp. PFR6]MDN3919676.1 ROK family protein [Pelomonas sp. PFR6]